MASIDDLRNCEICIMVNLGSNALAERQLSVDDVEYIASLRLPVSAFQPAFAARTVSVKNAGQKKVDKPSLKTSAIFANIKPKSGQTPIFRDL